MKKTCRYIFLTRGKVAIVDFDDYDYLAQFKWCSLEGRGTCYAHRAIKKGRRRHTLKMHRALIATEKQIDHINGNGLDNRRCNLRPCSSQENAHNRKTQANNQVGFKGVSKNHKKWMARITIDSRTVYLGSFKTREQAAIAYNKAALKHFGEFARLNQL